MKHPQTSLTIDGKTISLAHPTYFIADIAANHDGDLERAKELIYLAKESGADAAKFQHFTAGTIVSDKGFRDLGKQASHQASWKKSVYEVYADATLHLDWTPELRTTCEKAGITFFTSPYSFELVDAVDPYVPAYKIGSGDITWTEIIAHIAAKQKPYLIATGASTTEDVVRAVRTGLTINDQLALLQCNTNYTASIENMRYVQLSVLKTYQAMFPNLLLGLSDHTPGHATVLGAVALGARIIEKHFTDDINREGPDHRFSMDRLTWSEMVERTRELESALGVGIKQVEENERVTVVLQRRSIRVKRDLRQGEILRKEDIEMLRPCPSDGIPPYQLPSIIDKRLIKSVSAGSHLTYGHVEQ